MSYSEDTLADLYAWGAEHGLHSDYVDTRIKSGTVQLRDKWNSGSHDPDTYYSQECQDEYIYDLTAWHGSGTINEWFAVVKTHLQHYKPGRLLDYGAGIGTYSMIAAELGWEVDACDLNQSNLDYIAWRADRHDLPVHPVLTPSGLYDAIICIDTIEHLPDPTEFPRIAASILFERGLLIATWTFHTSGGMHPMHHGQEQITPFLRELYKYFAQTSNSWPVSLESIL